MTVFDDLIERLGQAKGNDYELDRLIFEQCHMPTEWDGSKIISRFRDGECYGFDTEDGWRHTACVSAPNYTGSIDASASAFPELDVAHCGIWLRVQQSGGSNGSVGCHYIASALLVFGEHSEEITFIAATEPLARTGVGLRAHAALRALSISQSIQGDEG